MVDKASHIRDLLIIRWVSMIYRMNAFCEILEGKSENYRKENLF